MVDQSTNKTIQQAKCKNKTLKTLSPPPPPPTSTTATTTKKGQSMSLSHEMNKEMPTKLKKKKKKKEGQQALYFSTSGVPEVFCLTKEFCFKNEILAHICNAMQEGCTQNLSIDVIFQIESNLIQF